MLDIKKFFKREFGDVWIIYSLAAIFLLFFNAKDFNLSHIFEQNNIGYYDLLLELLVTFFLISFLLLLASFNVIVLKILIIILLMISNIYFFVLNNFGISLDENTISNAMVSLGHVDEILDFYAVLFFLLFFGLPSLLILMLKMQHVSKKKHLIANLFILFFCFSLKPQDLFAAITKKYSPTSQINSYILFFDRFYVNVDQIKKRVDLTDIIKFEMRQDIADLNVIVVIGESLRSDHMQIYGYNRDNNPYLMQEKNLLKFNVRSDSNLTTSAVNSILSHLLKSELVEIPLEKSIISVFKKFGYTTYWMSSQSSKSFGSGILNILGVESDNFFYRDYLKKFHNKVYDEHLLPELQKALLLPEKKFIILHTFGSHFQYHDRYPKHFEKYLPSCTKHMNHCEKQEIINSYDNTLFYTDYFLHKLFRIVDQSNAIVFFIADHGQLLGEFGEFGSGDSSKEKSVGKFHEVPMMIYLSKAILKDKFLIKKINNAKLKQKNQNISHDNFFDTVLDCVGIDSKLFARKLSLCQ